MKACVAASIATVISTGAHAQIVGCDALLRGGVFDTKVDLSSKEFESSFKQFFCSRASKSASGGGSGNLEVSIPGVVDIGGAGASSDAQSELNEMCKSDFWWRNVSTQTRFYISQASKVVIDGFNACMNARGLHSTPIYSSSSSTFNIGISYVWSGVPGDRTSLMIKDFEETNASCSIRRRATITNLTTYFVCNRVSPDVESQVIVYLDPGPSSALLTVPAVFKDWVPRKVGPGTIGTSEGWTIYVSQIGKNVSWQLDGGPSTLFIHNFSGQFVSEDEFSGIQVRTNKSTGCSVKQLYRLKVPSNYRIQGDAKMLPVEQQPTGGFCDLTADWTNILDLNILPR